MWEYKLYSFSGRLATIVVYAQNVRFPTYNDTGNSIISINIQTKNAITLFIVINFTSAFIAKCQLSWKHYQFFVMVSNLWYYTSFIKSKPKPKRMHPFLRERNIYLYYSVSPNRHVSLLPRPKSHSSREQCSHDTESAVLVNSAACGEKFPKVLAILAVR